MSASGSGLLRFLTCGSVDDGKSTLIGRLLHDSDGVMDDQAAALAADSERFGTVDGDLDLALLVDGLQAEREQGITIDVAYRYFASNRRSFIVADTPGHEQYTRNMVTGASTADAALILIDARKGVIDQTRRHSIIADMLGIRHVVLVVNKMDLVDFAEDTFVEIVRAFHEFVAPMNFRSVDAVPVSALLGDNVCRPSDNMTWYAGPTVLARLETLDVEPTDTQSGPRLSVQWVNRPDADFRGYAGTITGGEFTIGDPVIVEPSGVQTHIADIVTYNGNLERAESGTAVTLTLSDDVDASRGEVIRHADASMSVTDQVQAHVIWMSREPMMPGRQYLLKLASQTATAWVSDLKYAININNLDKIAAKSLEMNDVGVCNISIDRQLACDAYEACRETGAFILIDRLTYETVCAGMIDYGLRRASNLTYQKTTLDKATRATAMGQMPAVIWLTGMSGAGKSTVANRVEAKLHAMGKRTYLLDGDNVRHGLNRDLGFTDVDRVENVRRFAEVAKLFADAGLIVLVSVISPFRSERDLARSLMDAGDFFEVHVDASLATCEARDPKGLYAKARRGELKNFTGIDSPYEPPETPDLRLDTDALSEDAAADQVIAMLLARSA